MMIKELLQLLVGKVDAELLEAVKLRDTEVTRYDYGLFEMISRDNSFDGGSRRLVNSRFTSRHARF